MWLRHLIVAALILSAVILLAPWPTAAQSPQPTDADLAARLDRIEKQLSQIQEQLKKFDASKAGWQKVKETDRDVIYFDTATGKVKMIYVDGTERVVDK
jgi:hypothetical protein